MLTPCDINIPHDRARAMLELKAVMAWPRQSEVRRSFLCFTGAAMAEAEADRLAKAEDDASAEEAQRWIAAWEEVYQTNGGRRELVDAPSGNELLDRFDRGLRTAVLAGRVIAFCVQLSRDGRFTGKASIRTAKDIINRHLPINEAKLFDLPRSRRPVDEAWSTHGCVAHLAAAALNTGTFMVETTLNGRTIISKLDLISMLRSAATVQQIGAEIIPHSRTEPVLPADQIIRVGPGIEPFAVDEVTFLPIAESVATSLHKNRR